MEEILMISARNKQKTSSISRYMELSDDKKFHDRFNQQFMKKHYSTQTDDQEHNPFQDGYGSLMDNSEYHSIGSSTKINYNEKVEALHKLYLKKI